MKNSFLMKIEAVTLCAVMLLTPFTGVLAQPPAPNTLPTGGQIVSGQGAIKQNGNQLNITQSSNKLITNWQTFSIGQDAAVNFVQPASSSVALNRVLSADPSSIFGRLTANGQVFLLNPSGVVFGKDARVDVGGLVTSTLNMNDSDFLSGKYIFQNSGSAGSITNEGRIQAADGGYVAFIAPRIENNGTVIANKGTVAMAAGDKVSLDFTGDNLINFTIDKGAVDALVQNNQLVQADGGQVLMSAKAANSLTTAVVNNTGIIQARTLENKSGRIVLIGDMKNGTMNVGGTLDASAPNVGDGGFIETSAAHVKVEDGANITTLAPYGKVGKWFLDPQDFTIAAAGGDITGSQLSTNLGGGNVIIQSSAGGAGVNGDIFVNADVSWNANTTLTLSAVRNINVNANITATGGTAGLNLFYGGTDGSSAPTGGTGYTLDLANHKHITLSGGNATLKIGNTPYTMIHTVSDFTGMTAGGNYALGDTISLSGTTYSGAVYTPTFTGKFDGLGNAFDGLIIRNSGGGQQNLGLFAQLQGATVRNLGVTNISIQTSSTSGGAAGTQYRIGGLAGVVGDSTLIGGYSAAAYTTTLDGVWSSGTISTANNYSSDGLTSGDTQKLFFAGGLIGSNNNGTLNITRAYSTANISSDGSYTGYLSVGGLVGDVGHITSKATAGELVFNLSRSYATGSVVDGAFGTYNYYAAGGLIGVTYGDGVTVSNVYSWGNAIGSASSGGITGWSNGATTYTNCYTTQSTTGNQVQVSGTNMYANVTATSPTAGTNLPVGFSSTYWSKADGAKPVLVELPTPASPLYVKVTNGAGTYGTVNPGYSIVDGSGSAVDLNSLNLTNPSGSAVYTVSGTTPASATAYDVSYLSGLTLGGANAALYTLNPFKTAGSYTVGKAPLTVTANNAGKTYDGLAYNGGNGVSYTGFMNGETNAVLGGALAYGGVSQGAKNAGIYIITPSGLTSNNYSISYVNGALTISKAPLTITAQTNNKIYDGTTTAAATPLVAGLLGADTVTGLVQAYGDKNAGSGKTLSVTGYTVNDGNSGGNYTVTTVNDTTGVIGKAPLTITAQTNSKTYDGTTSAAATPTVTGLQGTDTVTGKTEAYANKNAGSGKTISVTGYTVNDGNSGNNYTVTAVDDTTGVINKAPLTITAQTNTRTYDGTTTAAATPTVTGLQGADTVTGLAQAYGDKNAGGGKTLSVTGYTVNDSNSGGNYTVTTVNDTTGVITPKTLSGSITGTPTKGYDGNTTATLAGSNYSITGWVGSEGAAVTKTTGTYNSKDVATANTVTVLLANADYTANDGTLLSNYVLPTTATGAGTITPKTLIGSITGTPIKIYDGSTGATLKSGNFSINGWVGNEGAAVTKTTGTYNSKDVATANTVTVLLANADYTANDGTLLSNYVLPTTATGAGTITPKTLSGSITGTPTKTYDGNINATLANANYSITGWVGNEGAAVTKTTGAYNSKDVAAANTVTVQLASADYTANDGMLLGNYVLPATVSGTGAITKKDLTVKADDKTKTYGDADPALTATYSGLISGETSDVVSGLSITAPIGKNATAGTHDISVSGGTADNYAITYQNGTLTVDKALLTVKANDQTKQQGSGDPSLTYSSTGFKYDDTEVQVMSGGLVRTPGEIQGAYEITHGSLDTNSNYKMAFSKGSMTITPVVTIPTVTPPVQPTVSQPVVNVQPVVENPVPTPPTVTSPEVTQPPVQTTVEQPGTGGQPGKDKTETDKDKQPTPVVPVVVTPTVTPPPAQPPVSQPTVPAITQSVIVVPSGGKAQTMNVTVQGGVLTLSSAKQGGSSGDSVIVSNSSQVPVQTVMTVFVVKKGQAPVAEKGFSVEQSGDNVTLKPVDSVETNLSSGGATLGSVTFKVTPKDGKEIELKAVVTEGGVTIESKSGDLGQLTGSNRDLVVGTALMEVRSELNIHADKIRAVFISEGTPQPVQPTVQQKINEALKNLAEQGIEKKAKQIQKKPNFRNQLWNQPIVK